MEILCEKYRPLDVEKKAYEAYFPVYELDPSPDQK